MVKKQKIVKRIFDFLLSLVLIFICVAPIIFLMILSSIDTRNYGVFFQKRIGENGNLFLIYKIRTINNSHKISKFGRFLRNSKLDELPQLINIFLGDMSFVGPRPDLVGLADRLVGEDRVILTVKPGLTGPASLKFINEEKLLLSSDYFEGMAERFWIEKVIINKNYVLNYHFYKDLVYIYKTVFYAVKNLVV